MLTALKENGERLCLGDGWDKSGLMFLREKELFSCPQCRENVILKLGDKRIFHFSHSKGSQCQFDHERESEYHLNGKMQLYQWLKKQNLNPELEYYDSKIKQRADVIFYIGNKKFALEYQCSRISEIVIRKRTDGYLSIGFTPIWILGANQLTRKNSYLSSLTDFHYLFLQKYSSNVWMIPYYCSKTKMFILQRSIQPMTIRNAFSDLQFINYNAMNCHQLISPTAGCAINLKQWVKELHHWKNKQIQYHGSYQNPFLNSLYLNNLNLFLLPPYLGLPIQNSPYILTPPLIWQCYLFIDVFIKWDVQRSIKFHDIYIAFMKRVLQNHIQLRLLPLLREGDMASALQDYLELLVRINVLRRINYNSYMLNQSITFPQSVSEQKDIEEDFYEKFEKIIL